MNLVVSFFAIVFVIAIALLELVPDWVGPLFLVFSGYLFQHKEKKPGKFFAVLGIFFVAYTLLYPSGSWRYRMNVAIETPEGVRVGHAVREISVNTYPVTFFGGAETKLRGEAVVIDLGPRGLVFALMRGDKMGVDYGKHIFFESFGESVKGRSSFYKLRLWHTQDGGMSADLTHDADKLPMLVRFRDINDPKTVERVDPADMAATLGAGVSLKSVTIEITDDSVTEGIEKVLPSWKGTGFNEWQMSLRYGNPLSFDRSDFQKGTNP